MERYHLGTAFSKHLGLMLRLTRLHRERVERLDVVHPDPVRGKLPNLLH